MQSKLTQYSLFNHDWWQEHRRLWYYPWCENGWVWHHVSWRDFSAFWDMPIESLDYDYGAGTYYYDDVVYDGSQPIATDVDYYQQADELARSGAADSLSSVESDWRSLGVFLLVRPGRSVSQEVMELAIDRQGHLRGNYVNFLTNQSQQITGFVNRENKRAAWTIGNDSTIVYETALPNLLTDQAPILVHRGAKLTQHWLLVRLNAPPS